MATETPDKLALAFDGRAISYAAFWRMIAARRAELAPHARRPGLALLAIDSLLEAWVLSLAARSLGLHTCVLRADADAELFAGVDVALVVTVQGEGRPGPAPAGSRQVRLSALDPAAFDGGPLPKPVTGSNWAERPGGHVLLTSGTTGRPKKVLSHCGSTQASSSLFGDGTIIPWTSAVSCLFNLGLWTGAGYWSPLWIWCGHGAVVIHSGPDFHRALAWPGLTHAVATPQYVADLLALPEDAYPFPPDMALTITAGSVTPAMAREARRRIAPLININLSSTEVGGWARVFVTSDEDLIWYRIDPHRVVEVVDDAGAPLPPFQLGRVRVRVQPGAEGGYFGPEEESARAFDGDWFYPGDLGELDGAGRIALHGRATDVVNIKGTKLAVGPWEREMQERLGCEGVCILSGRWGDGVERLHLFIESRAPVAKAALDAAVQAVLWGFEGVHAHKVDALPRTPLGKVQRTVLAQQLHDGVFGADGGTVA